MFFLQFIVGIALMILGAAMWYARRKNTFRLWLENTFLEPGDKLFDSRKSYSIYVRWMRYVAFFAGLAMVIPTTMLWDLVIGMVAAGVFWWMNRQKLDHDNAVRGRTTKTA